MQKGTPIFAGVSQFSIPATKDLRPLTNEENGLFGAHGPEIPSKAICFEIWPGLLPYGGAQSRADAGEGQSPLSSPGHVLSDLSTSH